MTRNQTKELIIRSQVKQKNQFYYLNKPFVRSIKNGILLICIFISPLLIKSQVLAGYSLQGHLATAIHPHGCNSTYITNFPNDSIWVNLGYRDSMTGNFSHPHIDANGKDLLLETGFNTSNYIVSLLLSNGQYSLAHNVILTDWTVVDNINWQSVFAFCTTGTYLAPHYVVPLDFNIDFGLSQTDTVLGIKIIFLTSPGDPDFAGAYIINPQPLGIKNIEEKEELNLYPNPFTDKINISLNNQGSNEIILYDIHFHKLIQQPFNNPTTINTEQLEKGMYFYEVRNKYGIIKNGKAIKE